MPTMPLLEGISPRERVYARPSWADPSLMMYANEWTFDTYITTGATAAIIVPADPKRWAIGFTLPPAIIAQPRIAPHNDPTNFGQNVLSGFNGTFWNIFNLGPIICNEWYVSGGAGQEIGIYQIIISV